MKNWTTEHCATEPAALQLVGPKLYVQRRNIQQETHDGVDGEDAYTDYVCESREITESELAMLESIEEIDTDKAIDAYTLQLIEEGVI